MGDLMGRINTGKALFYGIAFAILVALAAGGL